ncbi:hypothetical protein V6N13_003323 [Hibiscus sabdariffa]
MWGQRRYRQPLRQLVMPGTIVPNGPRPERPRQQHDSGSTSASTESRQRTGPPSTSSGPVPASEGPSTEPYTPIPPVFIQSSGSEFHFTMAPPMEGFFTGAFQPYSSMISATSHAPGQFFPSPHTF